MSDLTDNQPWTRLGSRPTSTKDADFGKKIITIICKQAKLSNLGHRKPARTHWKANASKTSHCFMRILVQRHNWVTPLETLLQSIAIVIGLCWTNFCAQKLNRRILTTFGFNRAALCATQPKLLSIFFALILKIAPRSCDLTPLEYCLWVPVKDKCYADKTETIDALKDNISEVIGEIQLHAIDNVLKN